MGLKQPLLPGSREAWDRLGTDGAWATGTSVGWMGGDSVLKGKQRKWDFGEAFSPGHPPCPSSGLRVHIDVSIQQTLGELWGSPSFYEPGLDTNATSLVCWLSPMAPPSMRTFLSHKACQPAPGARDPGDRHPDALLTWKCVSSTLFTCLTHVLHQACAVPVVICAASDAPGWLQGAWENCCTSVSTWPGPQPTLKLRSLAGAGF